MVSHNVSETSFNQSDRHPRVLQALPRHLLPEEGHRLGPGPIVGKDS